MIKRTLANSDLSVSSLCCGTVAFGTVIRGKNLRELYAAYRTAGGNFFDSAHCYSFWIRGGNGASEQALGECVRQSGDRKQLVIATKGGHPTGGDRYPRPDRYLDPAAVAQDITESLERLKMDQIDLYYLHRDDPRVPVGEIMDGLNAEIRRGRIRYLGASNWLSARIAAANAYASAHGLAGFIASQPHWNLAQPNPVADPTLLFFNSDDEAWHRTSGLPVVAYSAAARGYFASGGRLAATDYDNPISHARLQRAGELATQLGVTPNQVAVAYLLNQPFPVFPILGTTDPQHLAEAVQATTLRLTEDQLRWLRGAGEGTEPGSCSCLGRAGCL